MRLLIDMDSVLVQLLPAWLERYNRDYDDTLRVEDIHVWEMHQSVKSSCGNKIYEYLKEPGLYRNLLPMPEGPETVRRLMDEGHQVFLVTAPPLNSPHAVWDKLEWVREHLPFFALDHMIFCHQKWLLQGDILFDDCPTHLELFEQTSIAMSYPYNKGYGQIQVSSWPAFYAEIKKLSPHR